MGNLIRPGDLIAKFQYALNNKWGYIWGQSGAVWTEKKQNAATREQTVKWGKRWIGHHVADCSGMFYWAFKQLGGYMYHGSHTMYTRYCTAHGDLKNGNRADGKQLLPGTAVFKKKKASGSKSYNGYNYHHVGLYVGNGTVIEAKGTNYGVVTSRVGTWHAWGELKGVDYTEVTQGATAIVTPQPIARLLRRSSPMMRGDDVKELQEKLTARGFACGPIDGIFGNKTLAAVRAFQAAAGVTVDGIVGPVTWAALNAAADK